jgi:hypothetical protein
MNQQKLENIVSHIDYLISELKHVKSKLTQDEGLHLNVISDEIFAIELWDTDLLEPRMLCYKPEPKAIENFDYIKECQKALDTILTPRAYSKTIYWNSDIPWESLTEHYQKLDQLFKFEKRELDDNLKSVVKGRIDALYNL